MRRQGNLLGMMAAAAILGAAGVPVATGGAAQAPIVVSSPAGMGSGSALSQAFTGMSRRAMRFIGAGGNGGSSAPRYRKHPFNRTVAQDKRDARKARNRLRNKR